MKSLSHSATTAKRQDGKSTVSIEIETINHSNYYAMRDPIHFRAKLVSVKIETIDFDESVHTWLVFYFFFFSVYVQPILIKFSRKASHDFVLKLEFVEISNK